MQLRARQRRDDKVFPFVTPILKPLPHLDSGLPPLDPIPTVISSRDKKPDDPHDKKHRRNDPQHMKRKPKAGEEKYHQQCQQDQAHFELSFMLRDMRPARRNCLLQTR
jgi:hypothetical protein